MRWKTKQKVALIQKRKGTESRTYLAVVGCRRCGSASRGSGGSNARVGGAAAPLEQLINTKLL